MATAELPALGVLVETAVAHVHATVYGPNTLVSTAITLLLASVTALLFVGVHRLRQWLGSFFQILQTVLVLAVVVVLLSTNTTGNMAAVAWRVFSGGKSE